LKNCVDWDIVNTKGWESERSAQGMIAIECSRFLIYMLKNKFVRILLPATPKSGEMIVSGRVKAIYRNIMTDKIEMLVGNEKLSFPEPDWIVKDTENGINFVYGEGGEATDEEVFSEFRLLSFSGGSIDDALSKTKKNNRKVVQFKFQVLRVPVLQVPSRGRRPQYMRDYKAV